MATHSGSRYSLKAINGASVNGDTIRQREDLYCTPPYAVELLLNLEEFDRNIWECAAGFSHIADVFTSKGYNVRQSDIIVRKEGIEELDFLAIDNIEPWNGDIVTNPPYKYAREFVEKAMSLIPEGRKVAMLLKLTFLEGKDRRSLFKIYPPKVVYVSTSRIACGKEGVFANESAVCYAWFIWEKGFNGNPIIKWFN